MRTVSGDVPGGEFGVCDAHGHLFARSPLLPGREQADPDAAEAELRAFAGLGGRAVVQWTPYGMGRRSGVLVELARRTGVHVVAATGLHRAEHYPACSPVASMPAADLAELFVEELIRGVRGAVCGEAPRAGLINVACGPAGPDAYARRSVNAAADAHHATGAPVGVLLPGPGGPVPAAGTTARDVLDLLCAELDVPPHRVLVAHLGHHPDLRTQREAARSGAWLVLDGPPRARHPAERRLFDTLAALVEDGHGGRLLIGGATAALGVPGAPGALGMPHLLSRLRPRLVREFGEQLADDVFVRNPARAFAADWKE